MPADPDDKKPKRRLQQALGSLQRTGAALRKLKPPPLDPAAAVATLRRRHAARHATSGLHFAIADRVDFLNPADWDGLVAGGSFLSRPFLRVLEAHGPLNVEPRYALAYDGAQPVAAMLFQRVGISGASLRKPGGRRLVDVPLAELREHMLVCGNLLAWGARGFAFAPGVDAALRWQGVAEALLRVRRADKLLGESDLAMVKDFASAEPMARGTLRLLGYRSVETEPDMVLALAPEWKSFDDYLASLTSGYRSNAKKLLKDCAAAGVTLRRIDAAEMAAKQDELHGLYEQVHERQGLRLATLRPSYLPALAAALGERFVCRVAEREGRMVGFVTTVADGDTAVGYYVGYDRAANELAPIYLTLLQSTVEEAIGLGARRLSLGRTALEPKAKMGCRPEPLACAVRHRASPLNLILSALARTASHDEPPERSPFKKAGPAA